MDCFSLGITYSFADNLLLVKHKLLLTLVSTGEWSTI